MGFDTVNMVSTVGSFILAAGILLLLVNVWLGLRRGAKAGDNPWDAPTLEWATSSPPPPYNFALIPAVASRHPLWEDRLGEGSGRSMLDRGFALDHGKEALATTPLDAEPDAILRMPEDSPWPFLLTAAMSIGFAALLIRTWWAAAAAALAILACGIVWLWPRRRLLQIASVSHG
jgi:cytochrome c oxidase subunit 1/cytochrome c oxidase subunit I+III